LHLSTLSDSTFELFREGTGRLGLRSLVRGYVVDQIVKCLTEQEPDLKGVVHLAEGMRFFNCPKKSIHVRTGADVDREIGLFKDAISTTEAQGSLFDQESTTVYLQLLRHGITGKHTISVIADSCVSANALAYIGLYAEKMTIQKCVDQLKAQLIIFDENGEIAEMYEEKTSSKAYSLDPLRTSYSLYGDNNKG
jgi:phosphotransferase system HPr-like phosphotransfer protein